jgi:hypothetical protein
VPKKKKEESSSDDDDESIENDRPHFYRKFDDIDLMGSF